MNENRPYRQDDEWSDLPLPGQEESWKKMEALLDKEEKRRIIPPFFLNCAGIALFSAIVIAAAWFAFRPGGFLNESPVAKTENKDNAVQQTPAAPPTAGVPADTRPANNTGSSVSTAENISKENTNSNSAENNKNPVQLKQQVDQNNITSIVKNSLKTKKANAVDHSKKSGPSQKRKAENKKDFSKAKAADKEVEVVKPKMDITDAGTITPAEKGQKDSTAETAKVIPPAIDPKKTEAAVTNTPLTTDTATITYNNDKQEIKNNKPSRFSFSAGLGIQQQLRSGTQLSYSSDYYGKKGVFSEHIPSVYFRVHHKENWFAQAEFRFGAPQLVKDYSYARKIRYDTAANNLVVSTLRLRKLYYHQLPFSFNYNVLPRLSVGAGGVYSIFYRAVTEQEVKATNIFTGAESYSKITQRIPGFRDSFFFKSQVQFILNTDYRWKNLSIGLRYKKDLQPYIKYTKPDGIVDEEMNDAIEVILRYRLWKSKR